MTTPTPPAGMKPITATNLVPRQAVPLWVQIVGIPIGLAIAGGGVWFLYLEMREPPTHTSHIMIFSGFVLLGLLVAFGRWFLFPVIQQVLMTAQNTDIPWIGGRRKTDPPAGSGGGA